VRARSPTTDLAALSRIPPAFAPRCQVFVEDMPLAAQAALGKSLPVGLVNEQNTCYSEACARSLARRPLTPHCATTLTPHRPSPPPAQ